MRKRLHLAALPLLATTLLACTSTNETPQTAEIPEIHPGILQGYLPMDAPLDSKAIVPPAPAADSARQQMDNAISERTLALRGSARWDLAEKDSHLEFPKAADTFSCALGIGINEQDTPDLYMLLRRTVADIGLATYGAKNAYQRERPFMVNGAPTCTPDQEDYLRKDGSYPSGHTSIGWGWGMLLTQLAPERAGELMARARSFGESRNVCNVHWRSDVTAGRMVAAAAVARLQNNDEFLAAMAAARADVDRAREQQLPPNRDCAAEAAALAIPI